jgi:hypothetical protein
VIKISVTNLDSTVAQFDAAPGLLNRATRSAVKAVARKAEREVERQISSETDIPRKLWSVHRVKLARRMPLGTALVWIGYNPVKASYLGQLKQADWGASARSYLFPGSFLARLWTGHLGIYRREGDKRAMTKGNYIGKVKQPITEERVAAPIAPVIAARVQGMVGPWFSAEFQKQVARRLKLK